MKFADLRRWLGYPILILLLAGTAAAQPSALTEAQPGADPILEQHGLVVTATAYRQIFEPYLQTDLPAFVTSDSLLHAFHMLLEDTLARYEEVNADRLPEILQILWQGTVSSEAAPPADGRDEGRRAFLRLKQTAWQHARLVLAVALALLNEEAAGLESSLAPQVTALVRGVRSGERTNVTIGEDTRPLAIDPADFQVPDYYRRAEALHRYFLAKRWLQTAPFRTHRDPELMAILLLGKTAATLESPAQRREIQGYLRCYRELMGAYRENDLLLAAQIIRDRPGSLEAVRDYLEVIQSPPLQSEDLENRENADSAFFIITPDRSPDWALMQSAKIPESLEGLPADGLRFCAMLGSGFARQSVGQIRTIDTPNPAATLGEGFAGSYFRALTALLDEPEPDAPAMVRGSGWQVKACNSALSAWVQMRATQPRREPYRFGPLGEYYGEMVLESGLVEPEPDFYAHLGDAVDTLLGLFDRCESFTAPATILAANLERFADRIAGGSVPALQEVEAGSEVQFVIHSARMTLAVLQGIEISSLDAAVFDAKLEAEVRALADSIRRGDYREDPAFQALVVELNIDRQLRWQSLLRVCRRLEIIAHKQLRGVAFTERENYLLGDYGLWLASIMGYGGTSFRTPVDNAPRIAPVPGAAAAVAIGFGRPRELLVRYPYRGRRILCRGAVLPFFPVKHDEIRTVAQWKKRLDSDERPPRPAWTSPILAPQIPRTP